MLRMQRRVGSQSSENLLDSEKQVSASVHQSSGGVPVPVSFHPEALIQDTDQIYAPSRLQDHSGLSPISWSEEYLDARSGFQIDDRIPGELKQEPVNLYVDSTLLSRSFSSLSSTPTFFPVFFGEDGPASTATSTSSTSHIPSVLDHDLRRLYTDCSPSQGLPYHRQGFDGRNGHEGDPPANATFKDLMVEDKRSDIETCPKRPRSSTPFTTFKVRKEKLGDRINTLQQLVSPFGKTDTASVLQDTIEYIKFLHDQVVVLCSPYMKLSQERFDADKEMSGQILKTRGLCLVPVSATLNVAKDNPSEFWAPTFGGSYR